jgi:hypothetical protein
MVIQDLGAVRSGAMIPSVGVSDEPEVGAVLAGTERHAQRVEYPRGAHVRRELPPDHAPDILPDELPRIAAGPFHPGSVYRPHSSVELRE